MSSTYKRPRTVGRCATLFLVGTTLAAVAQPPPNPPPVATSNPILLRSQADAIVQQHCVVCHTAGGAGPFAFAKHADIARRAPLIAEVTSSRYMPPWLPTTNGVPLKNARRLTRTEITTLSAWAESEANSPSSDTDRPLPVNSTKARSGTSTSITLKMTKPFVIPNQSVTLTRTFIIPFPHHKTVWLSQITIHPQHPFVVRHAELFLDTHGVARVLQSQSGAYGYTASLAGLGDNATRLAEWSPNSAIQTRTPGFAFSIPPRSNLVLQIAYEPTGEKTPEQTSITVVPSSPGIEPLKLKLGLTELYVQPGQIATVSDKFTLTKPAILTGIAPHGNPVCRQFTVTSTAPTGHTTLLLSIPDWNSDWEEPYQLSVPQLLPAGTVVSVTVTLDNTDANPRNPQNPPMLVMPDLSWSDEMASVELTLLPGSEIDRTAILQSLSHNPEASVTRTTTAQHG